MDQFTELSSSSINKAYCPSWLLPHPMDVTCQAPNVDHQLKNDLNQLSLVIII